MLEIHRCCRMVGLTLDEFLALLAHALLEAVQLWQIRIDITAEKY